MAHKDLDFILNRADENIRQGRMDLALQTVRSVHQGERKLIEASGPLRAHMMNLYRRCGQAEAAIRLGFPYLRGKFSEISAPTTAEVLEYGAALIFCDLVSEGGELLSKLSPQKEPMVLFHLAMASMPIWDYKKAEEYLEAFLKLIHPSEYFYSIAQVNLASCYIMEQRYDNAENLMQLLLAETVKTSNKLLQSHILELMAQVYFFTERFPEARKALNDSKELIQNQDSIYALFIEKWEYLLAIKTNQTAQITKEELIRKVTLSKHYETLREIDFYEKLFLNDQPGLQRIFCGTPHLAYRQNIQKKSKVDLASSLQNKFFFQKGVFFQPLTTPEGPSAHVLTTEQNYRHERLLTCLTSDFYSPWNLHQVFQKVFPGQWYHPEHSKNLVHQSIFHLRKYLKQREIPLRVIHEDHFIYLECLENITLEFSQTHEVDSLASAREQKIFDVIKKNFANQTFHMRDLKSYLPNVSQRSLQRYLQSLVQQEIISKIGIGKYCKYKQM